MKKIIKFIKNWLGEINIIIGTGIFTYNIFNFDSSIITGKSSNVQNCFPSLGICEEVSKLDIGFRTNDVIFYYFHHKTLMSISIAAMLIVIGILIVRNKSMLNKKENIPNYPKLSEKL